MPVSKKVKKYMRDVLEATIENFTEEIEQHAVSKMIITSVELEGRKKDYMIDFKLLEVHIDEDENSMEAKINTTTKEGILWGTQLANAITDFMKNNPDVTKESIFKGVSNNLNMIYYEMADSLKIDLDTLYDEDDNK